MIKNYYAFFQINCGLPTVFNFLVRWTCPAYWVDFSTVTSGLPLAEYSECDEMGNKLLIVASKRYGDYVKEIAESMECFETISFVDNDR